MTTELKGKKVSKVYKRDEDAAKRFIKAHLSDLSSKRKEQVAEGLASAFAKHREDEATVLNKNATRGGVDTYEKLQPQG